MPNYLGKFITIEGGEGVGKSTLLKALKEFFDAAINTDGRQLVLFTREPGGTPEAEAIRRLILTPSSIYPVMPGWKRNVEAEIFLFMAARAAHNAEVIIPALQRGDWVISDRYFDSTMAYQMAAIEQTDADERQREKIRDMIYRLNAPRYGVTIPDVTLLVTQPDEILQERLKARYATTREDFIESRGVDYHNAVFRNYEKIADDDFERVKRVVNDLTVEDMVSRALNQIDDAIGSHLLSKYVQWRAK